MKVKIECGVCGNKNNIQTTMENDDGYSNYTVLDCGYVEFKCGKCGTFGSSDEYRYKKTNKFKKFIVECGDCGSKDLEYNIGDVDCECPRTHILCNKCKAIEMQEELEDDNRRV